MFDPLAKPGSANYGNLYVSLGDGGSGETPGAIQGIPQSLSALQGKILRITPDLSLRPNDKLSENGRATAFPAPDQTSNPFISIAGARPEIFGHMDYAILTSMDWDPVSNLAARE